MKTRRWLLGLLPVASAIALLASNDAAAQKITFGGGGGGSSTGTQATPPPPASTTSSSGASTSATTTKEETKSEEVPPTDEWVARDSAVDESTALSGSLGLLHTMHAQPGKSGQFRLAFTTEFFSATFLCSPAYPCANPAGGAPITGNAASPGGQSNHVGGTINVSASILDFLEIYASTDAYANANDANHPTLLQVLGDITFGAKVAYDFKTKFFWVGFAPELWLLNGSGSVGLNGNSTSARFSIPATLDLRQLPGKIPLRTSLNLSYVVDNSAAIVKPTEDARGTPVTRIERYGLGINRVDHFDVHLGAETFILNDRIRPFLEFSLEGAANRQGYQCHTNNPSIDNCLALDTDVPTTLTLGARFFPWKHGFSLLAAVDIGMTGVANFIEELAPNAPYMVYLGAGWAIDTWERPPVEKIKMVEKKVEAKAKLGHIKGFVHEKDKTDGIPGVVVAWDNHPELTALYTGSDGRFTTQELNAGTYTFALKVDGYKDGTCEATLPKSGADVQLDCPMEALPRVGTLLGHVRDGETNAPVPNATVKFKDAAGKELSITADSNGAFRFEGVAPGEGEISVDAPDYLAYVDHTTVKVRQEVTFDPIIRHKPKQALVTVGATEINIKQQIQFALDQDVILPESTPLLLEIADVLIKNPRIKQVEVQGHTDNTGTPEHNQDLSERRAAAVRNWLIQHGVDASRLVAKGYGQSKPLVPNVTTANKARNRRVQFIILDQDKAPTGGTQTGRTTVPF